MNVGDSKTLAYLKDKRLGADENVSSFQKERLKMSNKHRLKKKVTFHPKNLLNGEKYFSLKNHFKILEQPA